MKIFDLVQITTGIAVIGGLIAVVWQLNQGHVTAKTQLISDQYAMLSERWGTAMGETSAEVIAKSCEQPNQLNAADIQVLNAFYHRLLVLPSRLQAISKASNYNSSEEWESWASSAFYTILNYPYGRYWWLNIREWYGTINPEMTVIGNRALESNSGDDYTCADYPQGYLSWFQETQ